MATESVAGAGETDGAGACRTGGGVLSAPDDVEPFVEAVVVAGATTAVAAGDCSVPLTRDHAELQSPVAETEPWKSSPASTTRESRASSYDGTA